MTRCFLLCEGCSPVHLGRPLWREVGSVICQYCSTLLWALDNQSHSAPFADQSALTAVTTSLDSAHLDWYKRAQLQPRNQSVVRDHLSDSVITSTQRSLQLFTAPTLKQPATRQLPATAALRPGDCRTTTSQPTRLHNFSQQLFLPAHTAPHHRQDRPAERP
jgi:hypothetical protein